MKKFINLIMLTLIFTFMMFIISDPAPCKEGAIRGLLLCGRVIIPALFPFTVCVLFLINSNILMYLKPLSFITLRIFGLNGEQFGIMLLSFIGGYPIGAKLLCEAVVMKSITPKKAGVMLNFCINAGPAFIISAVGDLLFSSKKIGIILFAAHLSASIIICFMSRKSLKDDNVKLNSNKITSNPADNFVAAVSKASSSLLGICSFVILFSCIDSYLVPLCKKSQALVLLCGMLEATNSLTLTKNIYLISFFLGFSGICVWFQVFSVSGKIKIQIVPFVVCRLLQGVLSSAFTYILLKIFKVTLPTLSNNKFFTYKALYSTPALTISMLVMGIIFAVAITTRKYNCKLLEDIV